MFEILPGFDYIRDMDGGYEISIWHCRKQNLTLLSLKCMTFYYVFDTQCNFESIILMTKQDTRWSKTPIQCSTLPCPIHLVRSSMIFISVVSSSNTWMSDIDKRFRWEEDINKCFMSDPIKNKIHVNDIFKFHFLLLYWNAMEIQIQ